MGRTGAPSPPRHMIIVIPCKITIIMCGVAWCFFAGECGRMRRMKTRPKILLAFSVALAVAWSPAAAQDAPAARMAAVSVPPQKFIVDCVGGEAWKSVVLADKGQDPHLFEPAPRLMEQLRGCEIYFKVGMPFENVVLERLAKTNPGLKIVDMAGGGEGRNKKNTGKPDSEDSHDHAEDPHGWMSLTELAKYADVTAKELSRLDPANEAEYGKRAKAFEAEADSLKTELAKRLKAAGINAIAVYHPAWGHFAEEFGLEQIAVEAHGKSPGPRHLETVGKDISKHSLKKMFVQNSMEGARIRAFARRQGLEIVEISPLGGDPVATIKATVDALCGADPKEGK